MTRVALRRFPYPFRAALAISSDIDLCPRPTFVRLHRLINNPQTGLGLPVADSFFGCAAHERQLGLLTMDLRPSSDAPFIVECIGSGLIDTLHTWVDQNRRTIDPALVRALAEKSVEYCRLRGTAVPIWVNHGSPNNIHNLGCRLFPEYRGDVAGHPYYTADLLGDAGIRYVWMTEVVPWPLSQGKPDMTDILGIRAANVTKNVVKRVVGRHHHIKFSSRLLRLAYPARLRDGQRVWGFQRTNAHPLGQWKPRPSRRTIAESLNARFLTELIRREGFAVIYTHLGLPSPVLASDRLFTKQEIRALEIVADHFHAGRLWVAPTGQLLDYYRVSSTLTWAIRQEYGRRVITLLQCAGVDGQQRSPSLQECAGLTFTTPDPPRTEIRLENVTLTTVQCGHEAIGIPVPPPPDTSVLY